MKIEGSFPNRLNGVVPVVPPTPPRVAWLRRHRDAEGHPIKRFTLNPSDSPVPQIPHELAQRWDVEPIEYLGSRYNENWLVECRGSRMVLRGHSRDTWDDIAYELEVMRRLLAMGWPVPTVVEEPILAEGRTWCLFSWLSGAPRESTKSSAEMRARGRLLAQLHDSTALLAGMGQRRGFGLSNDVVGDPQLITSVQEYERTYPVEGHIMRWHIDKALEGFERMDLDRAEKIVLHSDFATWNLLFEAERLTGIIDFEATHLNYRVADFANSWRGNQDELIDGYEDVHKLTDRDWELLILYRSIGPGCSSVSRIKSRRWCPGKCPLTTSSGKSGI